MASTFGTAYRTTVFGQSHSEAIGCVVEGLPAGLPLDTEALARFMARRAPGQGSWSTPRKEADVPRFVSGVNRDGLTTGTPLCALIENTNTRSQDYKGLDHVPRPGHADFTAHEKWGAAADYAGGGHFSGRLTAPLCVAGGIALQALEAHGIRIAAHLLSVGGVEDEPFAAGGLAAWDPAKLDAQLARVAENPVFTTLSDDAALAMQQEIESARMDLDSVGGVVECVACGLPAGVGEPMFDGLENLLARALFGIPAVKGLEFGAGFKAAGMRGSTHNDPFAAGPDGRPAPVSNTAGGILGGISTGTPVVFRVAVKPTASIGREQRSADYETGSDCPLTVHGRHDPCIAPRAVPVVEAVCACVVLDALLSPSTNIR
jgi:chorismate synthase